MLSLWSMSKRVLSFQHFWSYIRLLTMYSINLSISFLLLSSLLCSLYKWEWSSLQSLVIKDLDEQQFFSLALAHPCEVPVILSPQQYLMKHLYEHLSFADGKYRGLDHEKASSRFNARQRKGTLSHKDIHLSDISRENHTLWSRLSMHCWHSAMTHQREGLPWVQKTAGGSSLMLGDN